MSLINDISPDSTSGFFAWVGGSNGFELGSPSILAEDPMDCQVALRSYPINPLILVTYISYMYVYIHTNIHIEEKVIQT